MLLELALSIIAVALVFHIWGSWKAVILLNKTIEVEKLAKSYGLDYSISNKKVMYIICILFSWLAYSALYKLGNYETKQE
jgi:ABC-type maltose transport system permease subunit